MLTTDGMVAAQSFDKTMSSDVVVGLTSYLMMTTKRTLAEGGLGACSQFVLHATNGKAVFITLDEFLNADSGVRAAVLTDPHLTEHGRTRADVDAVADVGLPAAGRPVAEGHALVKGQVAARDDVAADDEAGGVPQAQPGSDA